jgi:hypothetical protein
LSGLTVITERVQTRTVLSARTTRKYKIVSTNQWRTIMKTFIITFFAITTLATAAMANEHDSLANSNANFSNTVTKEMRLPVLKRVERTASMSFDVEGGKQYDPICNAYLDTKETHRINEKNGDRC